ncbi:MAG TPA: oxygenase MpaB family protein [Cyclobacteriaceae bacterium]
MKPNAIQSKSSLQAQRAIGDEVTDTLFELVVKNNWHGILFGLKDNQQIFQKDLPGPIADYFQNLYDQAKSIEVYDIYPFFVKYNQQIMAVLGLYSLPYCYAAADGAKVLINSKRLVDDPGRRLAETSLFVLETCSKDAFSKSGKGIVAIGKVRLMHAMARYYCKKGNWNYEWGEPVNQEDMAGTNMAFSLITLRGLKKLGYKITNKEANNFLAYWNKVGYLLGINEELLPIDSREAYFLEKFIRERNFKESQEGKVLTKALVEFIQDQEVFKQFPKIVESLMAYNLGPKLGPLLGLKNYYGERIINLFFSFNLLDAVNKYFNNSIAKPLTWDTAIDTYVPKGTAYAMKR